MYTPTGFAHKIFMDRYAIHSDEGFEQACARVSEYIASAEEGKKRDEYATRFKELLLSNRFSPGGRIWRGSGRVKGQLLNCFVVPAEDSREGWGQALKDITIISGTGGGVGINFSDIRPRGSKIRGTGGEATGAVSLMMAINGVADVIREGGGRRSALMFCLNYDHPDLPEFLSVKLDQKKLTNANISVCIDDQFIKLLDADEDVVFKWQGEERGRMPARDIFDKIIHNAWECGDPGILHIGNANKASNIWYAEKLVSTNPCGEIWLSPYDCCCLGAVNLHAHVVDGEIDWDSLANTVCLGVRFLDNVLDKNHYPMPVIQQTCQKYRRIGLGVMGLHDMLCELGVKYSSEKALEIIDKVMGFIKKRAYETSIFLAVEKGSFQALDREKFVQSGFCKTSLTKGIRAKILEHGIRNCAILTIAPTGTTSIISGVSGGIEPIFCPVYERRFNVHNHMHDEESRDRACELVVHPLVERFIKEGKDLSVFEAAHEITPENHCKIQVTCQKHVDNSISKTINLPKDYTVGSLAEIVRKYIPHLKGWTIYRDGSKGDSPLMPVPINEAIERLEQLRSEASVNDCPGGKCEISDTSTATHT